MRMNLQHCNVVRQQNQTNYLPHRARVVYQQRNRHESYLHEKPHKFPIEHFMPVVTYDILEYCHRERRLESLFHSVENHPWNHYSNCYQQRQYKP